MTSRYPNTDAADESFVSVYGMPKVSEAGIDHAWGCYLTLRHMISNALRKMLAVTGLNPEIDFEEKGIASYVRWLMVLVCAHCRVLEFDLGTEDPIESWRKIAAQCMRSEEWWRAVVALDCEEPSCTDEDGVTDPAAQDYKNSRWSGPHLVDVGDYIRTCETYVDDFFRHCRKRR